MNKVLHVAADLAGTLLRGHQHNDTLQNDLIPWFSPLDKKKKKSFTHQELREKYHQIYDQSQCC